MVHNKEYYIKLCDSITETLKNIDFDKLSIDDKHEVSILKTKLVMLKHELVNWKHTFNINTVSDMGSYTLQEIADKTGVTRERVRQIEASAIKKLKHPKVGRKLKNYLES